MQLIDQRTKKLMEECKERALEAGLNISGETLEYIVTNQDLIRLSPKLMIPTLYDFWMHEVEVLKAQGAYELYPQNPFETVINTRPPISFYNDNNPDWMNVMIFYHVLAHIDFFQNNYYYRRTWQEDFKEQALADKRKIAQLRSEHGRWVDYVIEFARQLDNLVCYYREIDSFPEEIAAASLSRLDYYFDVFLQQEKQLSIIDYQKEIEEYNSFIREHGEKEGEKLFFQQVARKYPEMEERFKRYCREKEEQSKDSRDQDPLKFLINHSPKLQKSDNRWMKEVLEIIRETSLFFAPQLRTKIMNEGWASYWHEKLFMADERIRGHEADFAKINAKVAALSPAGFNPYAVGKRVWEYIEEIAEKGKDTWRFEQIPGIHTREKYHEHTGRGQEKLFAVRREMSDSSFLRLFLDQDFINRHRLFVSEKKYNQSKRKWEYFIKSRKAEDYWQMIKNNYLPHPPSVLPHKDKKGHLVLTHEFEGRPLVQKFIPNVLKGTEFLWGDPVKLETHEVSPESSPEEIKWKKVVYITENGKLQKITQ